MARDAGLDDSYDVGTYPAETIVREHRGPGLVRTAAVVAAMAGLGGAGALGAAQMLLPLLGTGNAASPVQPPAAVVPITEAEFDITVETVDGKLKVTDVHEVE